MIIALSIHNCSSNNNFCLHGCNSVCRGDGHVSWSPAICHCHCHDNLHDDTNRCYGRIHCRKVSCIIMAAVMVFMTRWRGTFTVIMAARNDFHDKVVRDNYCYHGRRYDYYRRRIVCNLQVLVCRVQLYILLLVCKEVQLYNLLLLVCKEVQVWTIFFSWFARRFRCGQSASPGLQRVQYWCSHWWVTVSTGVVLGLQVVTGRGYYWSNWVSRYRLLVS